MDWCPFSTMQQLLVTVKMTITLIVLEWYNFHMYWERHSSCASTPRIQLCHDVGDFKISERRLMADLLWSDGKMSKSKGKCRLPRDAGKALRTWSARHILRVIAGRIWWHLRQKIMLVVITMNLPIPPQPFAMINKYGRWSSSLCGKCDGLRCWSAAGW